MKILIEEIKSGNGNKKYKKSYFNEDGEEVLSSIIDVKVVVTKDEYDKTVHLVYNSKRQVISNIYSYINLELDKNSPNTIEVNISALKVLYSYIELFNIDINNFTKPQISVFINFLYGLNVKGSTEFKNLSKRTADTINIYLAIYRKYMKYINIENPHMFNKKNVGFIKGTKGLLAHTQKEKITSYTLNQRTRKSVEVPKYVRLEEFKKIIHHVRKNYSLREELILRLMFENGLRLGEVLGLTLEDIKTTPEITSSTIFFPYGNI